MRAKAYGVDHSHSGRENSEKPGGEQGGLRFTLGPPFFLCATINTGDIASRQEDLSV